MGRYVFKLPDVGEGVAEAEIVKWHAASWGRHRRRATACRHHDRQGDSRDRLAGVGPHRVAQWRGGQQACGGFRICGVRGGRRRGRSSATSSCSKLQQLQLRSAAMPQSQRKGLASPAVRARATAHGIDLSSVAGTGPGRQNSSRRPRSVLLRVKAATTPTIRARMGAKEEGVEDIKIFGLRRRIAERMQDAKRRIPHFAYVEEVDVTELETLRAELNAALESASSSHCPAIFNPRPDQGALPTIPASTPTLMMRKV